MINKFIGRLIGKATAGSKGRKRFGKRAEIGPQGHAINPALVDERAANVVRTLKEAGYEAYIVGGAVRDLLLGLKPKDFDVATNPDARLRALAQERGWRILDLFHA